MDRNRNWKTLAGSATITLEAVRKRLFGDSLAPTKGSEVL